MYYTLSVDDTSSLGAWPYVGDLDCKYIDFEITCTDRPNSQPAKSHYDMATASPRRVFVYIMNLNEFYLASDIWGALTENKQQVPRIQLLI